MSTMASWLIGIFSVANILACGWLIYFTSRRREDEVAEGEAMGHVWDGDLREYNNPMPMWWLMLFYLTMVFGMIYFAYYPGLGNFSGLGNWSQATQYEREVAAAEARNAEIYARFAGMSLEQLSQDEQALGMGQRLYSNNCTTCHGSDGRGAPGFPNLRDSDWLYGGTPDAILTAILNGRAGVMPALGAALGEQGTESVVAHVMSLSGAGSTSAQGQTLYQQFCSVCHGAEGKGNIMLGAPNLTDDIWLYGGDPATITSILVNGRNGRMPPHRALLGEDRARALAAYVYNWSAQN